MSFVLESGCKGIAFWLTNQIFSQKSCLKTYLFNTCLQLTRVKHLIYLIKYTHAGAWVCACTYTQITCMAGDAVHGTRILSFWTLTLSFTNTYFCFWTRILFFWTRIKRIKRILMLEEYNSRTNLTNRYGQHWLTELVERVAHGSHSHGFFNAREDWRDEKII